MTWQSEDLYSGEAQAKSTAVTPLTFDSIDSMGESDSGHRQRGVDASHAKDAEDALKTVEARHRSEVEDEVRRAHIEERSRCEEQCKQLVFRERETVRRTCEQFGEQRTLYFDRVEEEVVKLSLAIAARILHREVKLDPLLLKGVVQVALNQVREGSDLFLHVPKSEAEAWLLHFQECEKKGFAVEVVADDRVTAGECVLETSLGSVNLGVEAQLLEVERGFFDLLKQRPS